MPNTVPGQLLAGLKSRRFSAIARLFAPDVDFQAWTPAGHWLAKDRATAAQIIEVWLTPGNACEVLHSEETSGAGGAATLECELAWHKPANWGVPMRGRPSNGQPASPQVALDTDPLVVLRQLYLLTIKHDLITRARVYTPGPRAESPDVDLERQARASGLAAAAPATSR
jgi:hypothetical protein